MYIQQFLKLQAEQIRPEVDLEELASLMMAVMDRLQVQWLLDPDNVNMVTSFKLFTEIVAGYLAPRRT